VPFPEPNALDVEADEANEAKGSGLAGVLTGGGAVDFLIQLTG
jgi:hypothetical protein